MGTRQHRGGRQILFLPNHFDVQNLAMYAADVRNTDRSLGQICHTLRCRSSMPNLVAASTIAIPDRYTTTPRHSPPE